jgi:hypothetical protein
MSIRSPLRVAHTFFKRGECDESTVRSALDLIENYLDGKGPQEESSFTVLSTANLLDEMSVDPSVVSRSTPGLLEDMNLLSSRLRRSLS